ncbi:MAG: DNA polymerase I, partial [Pseudomonadota bacterium]|nr:DNA polymerase I [Pseudomonadota bacterium]
AGEIKQNKRRESLIEFAEQARISRELVTLRTDTPLPVDMSEMGLTPPEAGMLMGFLKAMEFNTLTRRVSKRYDINADNYEASSDLAAKPTAISSSATTEKATSDLPPAMTDMPPIDSSAYECVTDMAVLDNWIEDIIATGYVAIDTETDGLDAVNCRLVGISLATRPGHACYIPLAHGIGEGLALADDVPSQLAEADVLARLKPLLQDASIMKILQNAKFDLQVLGQRKIEVHPVEDTMLMSYALAAGQRGHGMDELSELYLGHKPISIKELLGTGKSQITFDQVPLEKATPYAAEDVDITFRLWQMMRPKLVKDRVVSVYQTTEKPLVPVIVDMEKNGICVDRNVLSRLSGEFAQKMAAMEEDIYKFAGETFNIASPKQLGDILFDKMGLPGGKKTKTGAWGTGADVLEGLAAEGHDLAAQVLEWRGLAKLKSTYTDALPEFINPETGRIHTSYSLASTTTGRLASSDPNLQNIPIRTEDGRRIRTAFVAENGNLLVSADYSQIELRLLAHIADIDSLRQAFADGQDIHAMTASEMFGVPLADMTAETRRRAKAINFGIIYGISAFGLANQLGISRGEASDYIKAYFERFPGIKDYMNAVKQEAHAQGYVSTLFGRRIYLREIDSKIPARRAFAERAAINAPIQGSAADIIRRAMIAMPPVLKKKSPKSRMLLQVHDELIFEAPESETDKLMQNVREVMQNACAPRLSLSVPLVVEAQAAKTWDEAH